MGDRANIEIIYSNGSIIYFYTHYKGSKVQSILKEALKFAVSEGRINDEPYCARIIFCKLVEGYEKDSTGFGISPWPAADQEHSVPALNFHNKTIVFYKKNSQIIEKIIQLDDFISM